jgi:hypothetical protein
VGFAISNGIEEALTLNLSLPHTRQLMTSGWKISKPKIPDNQSQLRLLMRQILLVFLK